MNTLGSSKVHEKEVYSLWVILDHPVDCLKPRFQVQKYFKKFKLYKGPALVTDKKPEVVN